MQLETNPKKIKMLNRKTLLREKRLDERHRIASGFVKRVAKNTKYIYVKGGHAKNEVLGYLTVLNFERSFDVDIKYRVEYAPDDKSLYLNIYQPKDRDMTIKLPVFVYIHGGGWIGGLPENREAFTTRVASAGYFVISLFYGHAPSYCHPKPIENIYKAFAWLKDNAEQYNVDADEIFVGGESAGAHLSAMVGAAAVNPDYKARFYLDERSRNQKIRGLVLNCGVYDLGKAYGLPFKNIKTYIDCYCGRDLCEMSESALKEISPIFNIDSDFPPTFAISAENDKLAPLTFDLVERLNNLGCDVEHFHATGLFAVHAFAVAPVLGVSKSALLQIGMFLQRLQSAAEKEYPTPPKEKFLIS